MDLNLKKKKKWVIAERLCYRITVYIYIYKYTMFNTQKAHVQAD